MYREDQAMQDQTELQDELSAMIDGEAGDPAALSAQIQRDPALAQQLAQLQAVVAEVRQLPGPALRPEFVTRVMAQVREVDLEGARAPRGWAAWFSLPRLAAAGGLCAAALVLAVVWRGAEVPDARSTAQPVIAAVPEEVHSDVVAALADAGVDLVALAEVYAPVEDSEAATVPDEAIDAIFLAMVDAAWTPDDEVDDLDTIEHLNLDDQDTLRRLMQPGERLEFQNEG